MRSNEKNQKMAPQVLLLRLIGHTVHPATAPSGDYEIGVDEPHEAGGQAGGQAGGRAGGQAGGSGDLVLRKTLESHADQPAPSLAVCAAAGALGEACAAGLGAFGDLSLGT